MTIKAFLFYTFQVVASSDCYRPVIRKKYYHNYSMKGKKLRCQVGALSLNIKTHSKASKLTI